MEEEELWNEAVLVQILVCHLKIYHLRKLSLTETHLLHQQNGYINIYLMKLF